MLSVTSGRLPGHASRQQHSVLQTSLVQIRARCLVLAPDHKAGHGLTASTGLQYPIYLQRSRSVGSC
jgi:hypothetical protein